MSLKDSNNTLLATNQEEVDKLNSQFYSKFNYPWYPEEFPFYKDKDFWRKFLCQDIGDWNHIRLPKSMKIWVAGCGTNQAIYTALKYPNAEVIGTDLSPKSLEICGIIAKQVGVNNLTLEVGSINDMKYIEQFDYIICTGVIHHNSDPSFALLALNKALKNNGIMELMVYNFYHRILSTAFQKAIRIIYNPDKKLDFDQEYISAEYLIKNFPIKNMMGNWLNSYASAEKSEIADALIQPVEHSYTIESLCDLAGSCNLELLYYCINQYDKALNRISWNLNLKNIEYSGLSDFKRWQFGNLLMLENSPMLWFYLQKKDSDFNRYSEKQLCEKFSETKFYKAKTMKYSYLRSSDHQYESGTTSRGFPLPELPTNALALKVFRGFDSELTIVENLKNMKIDISFNLLNELRIALTTSAFPYLLSN